MFWLQLQGYTLLSSGLDFDDLSRCLFHRVNPTTGECNSNACSFVILSGSCQVDLKCPHGLDLGLIQSTH